MTWAKKLLLQWILKSRTIVLSTIIYINKWNITHKHRWCKNITIKGNHHIKLDKCKTAHGLSTMKVSHLFNYQIQCISDPLKNGQI